ncbi:CinA domain protein [Thioalkalivibrio nitratireducens DSM 14787]|uniref:CinA domain protein n=1 Tax=Thioalkalivibrio nitratireducens (strain DSM 14787 / UNIQEM 213 / ALEN2) TaxID=1255043 RepID=L0DVT0_THIND|nr:CinA family protein [Thioalkalivibrio nitratireducens]AGA33122.1 CinA domain protein [Thioalkalivibrio nitratireducens DSM 14787]
MSDAVTEVASALARQLQARGLRLCTAESCTGGGIAAALTDLAGSSAWFECGWVTYSNASKMQLLGVDPELLERWGAVSESVAAAMCAGALERSAADVAVSVTGIAGPGGGTPEKPVGLVWFGWMRRGGEPRTGSRVFPGDRATVRDAAAVWALRQLREHELARE